MSNTEKTLSSIASGYADSGIVNLGKYPRVVDKILTNRPSLDYLTDGGIPQGRLILIAGEKSAGKSSLTIQIADLITDKRILYLDTEATLTTDYIEQLGADPFKFDHCIPATTEILCNRIRENIKDYENSCIIVDSINNSASEEQWQKTSGERTMANRAIVMSAQLPIIVSLCHQYNVTLFVLSQIRDNMNKKNKFDSETIIPGGNSLHHNSSMTLELFPSSKNKEADKGVLSSSYEYGSRFIRIHCPKNKVGIPLRTIKIEFTYKEGFTEYADVAAAALATGVVTMSGAWIKYEGESIAQGKTNFSRLLKTDTALFKELRKKVYTIMENKQDLYNKIK